MMTTNVSKTTTDDDDAMPSSSSSSSTVVAVKDHEEEELVPGVESAVSLEQTESEETSSVSSSTEEEEEEEEDSSTTSSPTTTTKTKTVSKDDGASSKGGGSSSVVDKNKNNDFIWKNNDEPHASRRKEILQKYPQIKTLFGYDPQTKYTIFLLVLIQIVVAYYVGGNGNGNRSNVTPLQFFFVTYIIGGTINQWLALGLHELSHNLVFQNMKYNRFYGLFCNLPLAIPSFVTFKRYHMEHHRYQGYDGIDVDIPTKIEADLIGQSKLRKLGFVITQLLFYALRPMIVNPKKPGLWEGYNIVCCIGFDFIIWYTMGIWSLLYFVLGTLLGGGLHPMAGHFISEHYVFGSNNDWETYSYYGPLNMLAFNVGYHNEHHDFPYVPGSRLPLVREIASEYYEDLPQCHSWIKVIYDYIMDDNVNGFSRVKRRPAMATMAMDDERRRTTHHEKKMD